MISIKVLEIKRHAKLIRRIVPSRTTIPVLSMIAIRSDASGFLTMRVTDLDNHFEAKIGESEPNQVYIIDARLFLDIALSTIEDSITLENLDGSICLTAGVSRWIFDSDATEDRLTEWPKPKFTGYSEVKASRLKLAVKLSRFAMSNEMSRFTLAGAQTLFSDGIQMVATDGHRLVKFFDKMDGLREENFMITMKCLNLVDVMDEKLLWVSVEDKHIQFEGPSSLLISRPMVGKFPDYKQLIPPDYKFSVCFRQEDMLRVCKQVAFSQAGRRGGRSQAMVMQFSGRDITITATTDRENGFEAKLRSCDVGGDREGWFGVNSKYLEQFLAVVGKGEIEVRFKDNLQQVVFTAKETDGYDIQYVVMPLRI